MFRFKQFTIQQDRTAMKVCTDACVLGAWADVTGGRLLDIGTGTGLLALMAAQRNPAAMIDAVELDEPAGEQATDNVKNSPFADRIRVWPGRVQDFARTASERYDCILTNPPFYTNQLRSPDQAVNRALHTDDLPFDELIDSVGQLLNPGGPWWVLLPPREMALLTKLAREAGLLPFRWLYLQHHVKKPPFRIVAGFTFGARTAVATNVSEQTLSIYEPDGRTYTSAFRTLLGDFYLLF